MIQKGFFTTANELLERPYEIDIAQLRRAATENPPPLPGSQLLPPDGLYRTENEKGELVRLTIQDGNITELPDCDCVHFI